MSRRGKWKGLRVIDDRGNHEVLSSEREFYLFIAREGGYAVINPTESFGSVQAKVESRLSRFFPAKTGD